MQNCFLITKYLYFEATTRENPYLVTQMVGMDGAGSARDTSTCFEIPIPTTKVLEIHNCWLARAALARQPFFPQDIWSQFTALSHQERAYTGGTGPDAYKPIDTRSRLHMPPQYVIVPLIQQLEEQLEEHPSRSITCTVKHEGVHVHVVYHSRDNIKIYTKNDYDASIFFYKNYRQGLREELEQLWDAALEKNMEIKALRGEFVFEPTTFQDQNAYERLKQVVADKNANKLYIFDCTLSDPIPQYMKLKKLSDIITTDKMEFGALRVSEYKHLNTWNYEDNLKEFIEWCTQNIARNEGIIACCEESHEPFKTFKLKLKYWVYYKLLRDRQLIYDYCSFNSNTTLHERSFLETQVGRLTKPGTYSILSFHDTNIIRADPGAPMSDKEVIQYNNIHRVIHNEQNKRNHLSHFKKK